MTIPTPAPHPTRRLTAIGNGLITTVLDVAFVACVAAMLWVNGRSSAIDVPLAAMIVTALIGGFIIAIRRGLSLRRRLDLSHPAAALAERITAAAHVLLIIGAVIAWKMTGIYQLGWGAVIGAIAIIVGNAILLMSDVTSQSQPAPPRQANLHARRLVSVEVAHITAAIAGIVAIALTTSVHLWRGEILNGSTLLVAAAIAIGVATAALLHLAVKSASKQRTTTPPKASAVAVNITTLNDDTARSA